MSSGQFRFNGNKLYWTKYTETRDFKLSSEGIGYIIKPGEIQRRLTEPTPPTITPGNNAPNPFLMEKYKKALDKYANYLDKVPEDCDKGIACVSRLLTDNIRADIKQYTDPKSVTASPARFIDLNAYIERQYGPSSLDDRSSIKKKIENATDKLGYKYLLLVHKQGQNALRQLYKRNAQGVIERDAAGNALTHEISDEEMRHIYLGQIKTNEHMITQIRTPAQLKNWSYKKMVKKTEKLLEVDCKTYDPKSVNFDDSKTHLMFTTDDDANVISPPQNVVANLATSNAPPYRGPPCRNCRSPNHPTRQCQETKCYTCNIQFSTLQDRIAHVIKKHKGRNNANHKSSAPSPRSQSPDHRRDDEQRDRSRTPSPILGKRPRADSPYPHSRFGRSDSPRRSPERPKDITKKKVTFDLKSNRNREINAFIATRDPEELEMIRHAIETQARGDDDM